MSFLWLEEKERGERNFQFKLCVVTAKSSLLERGKRRWWVFWVER